MKLFWGSALSALLVLTAVWGGYALGRPWQLLLFGLTLTLALVGGRRLQWGVSLSWLGASMLPFVLSFPTAYDHQWAVYIGLVAVLGTLVWGWSVAQPLGSGGKKFLASVVACSGVVALVQAGQGPVLSPEAFALLPEGMVPTALARLATGRAFGTVPLPGHFAALQALVVPILAFWIKEGSGRWRLVPGLLLTLSLAATLVTRSLIGTTLWFLAFALSFLTKRIPKKLGLAVVLFLVALPLLLQREDLLRLEPLALRWVNWQLAWWCWRQSPWLGVGPGGMGLASLTSPWAVHNITLFAHNTPLQILAEFGFLGLPLLLMGIGFLSRFVVTAWSLDRPGALAAVVGLIHNVFDFSFYEPAFLYPYLLLVGSTCAQINWVRTRRPPRFLLLLAGPALLIASLEVRCNDLALEARAATTLHDKVENLLKAASWTPWRLSEVLEAANAVFPANDGQRRKVLALLDQRAWVAPRSASFAHAKALLLLGEGRRGEAWAWAREAVRRAPHRVELRQLEEQCRP